MQEKKTNRNKIKHINPFSLLGTPENDKICRFVIRTARLYLENPIWAKYTNTKLGKDSDIIYRKALLMKFLIQDNDYTKISMDYEKYRGKKNARRKN